MLSKEGGIDYRYGARSDVTDVGLPEYLQPASTELPAPYTTNLSKVYWQVGGPRDRRFDDYSSNQAQVAFVADNPAVALSTGPSNGGGIGVTLVETLAMRENTFTQSPGLTWTMAGSGLDEPSARTYGARGPVALGRCYGRPTWCVNSLIGFQNGLIGSAGSNTSIAPSTVQLAAGYVPTAIAVTNGGEFALVTIWDTANMRGRLGVIALSEKNRGTWLGVTMPGIPSHGAWGFMKIVGYVDLPDMKEPTDVSVTTGVDPESMHRLYVPGQSNFVNSNAVDLRTESIRKSFADGGVNANSYARAGVAVVTSKSERKATFIDLKPLLAYYRSVYFTAGDRASFDNAINNTGMDASQWPYQLTASTSPTVIKTVSLAQRPTAVKVSLYETRRAWIATEDGTLHIYNLGEYASTGDATASTITEVGAVAVGKNPTHIAYDKHNLPNSVIVVSRGERKIDWVTFSGNGGSIVRTLRDKRMIDPVTAEDNDNHGTESFVLTVADYSGKRISNYRYGPVIFHTNPGAACAPPNGCGIAGGQAFEYGGSFSLPGKPFHITGANVP